jgi:hypothetical protein
VSRTPSRVGIRAMWKCCICDAAAVTIQVVLLGPLGRLRVDPPAGWRVHRCRTYCGDHNRRTALQGLEAIYLNQAA